MPGREAGAVSERRATLLIPLDTGRRRSPAGLSQAPCRGLSTSRVRVFRARGSALETVRGQLADLPDAGRYPVLKHGLRLRSDRDVPRLCPVPRCHAERRASVRPACPGPRPRRGRRALAGRDVLVSTACNASTVAWARSATVGPCSASSAVPLTIRQPQPRRAVSAAVADAAACTCADSRAYASSSVSRSCWPVASRTEPQYSSNTRPQRGRPCACPAGPERRHGAVLLAELPRACHVASPRFFDRFVHMG